MFIDVFQPIVGIFVILMMLEILPFSPFVVGALILGSMCELRISF